jgi:hypothetical protein
MSHDEIGALVRSVSVLRQTNDSGITVVSLDLHTAGFVVRCDIAGGKSLLASGLVAMDLRDSLNTRYERAGNGEDFIAYKPTIPGEAAWLKIYTRPETHIDLGQSNQLGAPDPSN